MVVTARLRLVAVGLVIKFRRRHVTFTDVRVRRRVNVSLRHVKRTRVIRWDTQLRWRVSIGGVA